MAIAVLDELLERGTEALYGHGLMDCRIMRKSETLLYGKISVSFDLFSGLKSYSAGGHVSGRERISACWHVTGRKSNSAGELAHPQS